ncbi:MAG: glycosyltransferase family 4 protein [bacterium]|nr:glycosyltransferase family 4 protein [bacterium]
MIHYITTNGIGNAWVANELRQVELAAVPFMLHTMRPPGQTYHLSEWALKINRRTRVIYPLPRLSMLVSALAGSFLFGGRFFAALANALFGERETLRGRIAAIAHLLVACHWARLSRNERVTHIHAQWIHSSGTIAMYGAWLLGVPFSFTGHATDLFRDRVALKDKIRRAEFIICISSFHRDFYVEHGARPEQLRIVYCGIDVDQFSSPEASRKRSEGVIRIRSSGRLVEKKGFRYLIDACKVLAERGVALECVIGGSGPLEQTLRKQVDELGLSDRMTVTGEALKQEKIPEFMHGGDVYCLPCVWASDNDVDGLPQMLMEAMACGLPAVSTRLVGIPDLVVHEKTGILVEPNDAMALADAILRLGRDRDLAERLARAGRQHVLEKFDISNCLEPLIAEFRAKLGQPAVSAEMDELPHPAPTEVGA